jgi:adenosylcobinamide-GDP ribazoletransferase
MSFLRDQWISFYTAVGFLTRFPVPGGGHPDYLDRSAKWSPFVGTLVGAVAAGTFAAAHLFLPVSVSVVLAMAVTACLTGGFHEDGFADSCDAFGGGYTKEDVLRIMKDSRIGSFGALALVLLLLLKYAALTSLASNHYSDTVRIVGVALIAGHTIGRFASISFLMTQSYVRDDSGARAKPVASGMTPMQFAFAAFCTGSVVVCMCLALGWHTLAALLFPLIVRLYLARMFLHRIGGYTGDALGMAEQAAEAALYVGLAAILPSSAM